MRKSFERLKSYVPNGGPRNPRLILRIILGTLVVLNLLALWFVVSPPGGSVEDLEQQAASLRSQAVLKKASLERTRAHAQKVAQARDDETRFQAQYFTDRRVASSTFVSELVKSARDAGIKAKEHVFVFDPIEGSDTLSMMTITGNYEGTYADLVHFINRLDRSGRFLILDSLTASPQQSGGLLNVTVKLNAFVKDVAGAGQS